MMVTPMTWAMITMICDEVIHQNDVGDAGYDGNACPAVCVASANDHVEQRQLVAVRVKAWHPEGRVPQVAPHLRNIRVTR